MSMWLLLLLLLQLEVRADTGDWEDPTSISAGVAPAAIVVVDEEDDDVTSSPPSRTGVVPTGGGPREGRGAHEDGRGLTSSLADMWLLLLASAGEVGRAGVCIGRQRGR